MTRTDVVALVGPFAVGAIGSIPTARAIPTWYRTLDKPRWNPPDAIFGPVWTTLYGLMGVALLLVRRAPSGRVDPDATPDRARERAQEIFALQLALNLAWSFVFFGGRDLRGALAVIAGLWVAILATIAQFWSIRRAAALLLVPYLAWVSFAALLNAEVARRNPPAAAPA